MTAEKSSPECIVDAKNLNKLVSHIAEEIIAREKRIEEVALVGIYTAGVPLAERIAGVIKRKSGVKPPVGTIDIALYRDDVGLDGGLPAPVVGPTELDFNIPDYTIYLIDDVLFTGRTVRSAIDGIIYLGRPKAIRLAVLIDRGHRELPIQADIVGETVKTSKKQNIEVELKELNEGKNREEGVYLYK
ncbi:MAG: bifunctional pyr operon transcriptional regulator/uracil phosphoribosyltransferase PyrR [Myxococcota bacterium]